MKRILVALMAGTLFGSLLTGLTYLSSATASGSGAQAQNTVTAVPGPAPVAVAAPAPITIAGTATKRVPAAPEDSDPVLGTRKWGTRTHRVKGAKGQAVTAEIHDDVESFENKLLTEQQSEELLCIFRHSKGVRRLVDKYGGDPCLTMYYVQEIDANEDYAGNNTPWVTATLRADFASPEGLRGIEMHVYRQKTDRGLLDNTPYVSFTQISYLDSDGNLSTRAGYHHPDEDDPAVYRDGLQTIRFKN